MAKSYPLYLAVEMCRYGSLININPYVIHQPPLEKQPFSYMVSVGPYFH